MKRISKALITLMLLPFFFSCKKENYTKIIVCSDSHYLAKSLFDSNRDYDFENFVTDGRTFNYNSRANDELFERVKKYKPDYFIITGDLVYNGSETSHLEFSEKLLELYQLGIQPLVIPGNHDINIGKPRDYSNTNYNVIPSIDEDKFKEIYDKAGYGLNYIYDPDSLSYIVETKNNEWLIMLDTSLHKYNIEYGMDFVSGNFESYDWLEDQLKIGMEKKVKFISFSHHSLISHNSVFDSRYKITSSDQLCQLYSKYGVNASFSGHLHIQNIVSKEGITDICQSSIVTYGNRYGEVEIGKDKLKYLSQPLDFKLDDGSSFRTYSFELFKKMQNIKNSNTSDFYALFNTYYFDGSLFKHKELKKDDEYTKNIENGSQYFVEACMNIDTNNHKATINLR